MLRILAALCIAVLTMGVQAAEILAAAESPAAPKPAYTDPVPHNLITQPYRVCQDLEELTARIDNLYRKPYAKLTHNAVAQTETVYFKDTVTGHEIVCLTRELCNDMGHGDLQRPVWNMNGSKILFLGNRGFFKPTGEFQKGDWGGWKFEMDADYGNQRPLVATILDKDGRPALNADGTVRREQMGVPEKFNTFDSIDSRYVYYGIKDTLWRVCLATEPGGENTAQPICTFCNAQRKLIQEISDDHKLLVQDINADPDRKTKVLPYMPEIHLIDLNKKTDEPGFYYHHPADYGLEEVRDGGGKVVHDAKNNYQFHSLKFGPNNTIN